MLRWLALLILALMAACTFKSDTNDLQESLRKFPIPLDLEAVEVLLAKGKDYGPNSGHDICYILKLDEDEFTKLADQTRTNGSQGASGVYEQNSICEFTLMRERYAVGPTEDAYSLTSEDGTHLDVLLNQDSGIVLLFFWRT